MSARAAQRGMHADFTPHRRRGARPPACTCVGAMQCHCVSAWMHGFCNSCSSGMRFGSHSRTPTDAMTTQAPRSHDSWCVSQLPKPLTVHGFALRNALCDSVVHCGTLCLYLSICSKCQHVSVQSTCSQPASSFCSALERLALQVLW